MAIIKRVLVTDPIDKQFVLKLQSLGLEVDEKKLNKAELLEQIGQYDCLIVRSGTQVTADVLQAGAGRLKLVGRAGTGVDNIDVPAATKQGIAVMNTPGANTTSAAELTCALILALSRHIPQAVSSLKDGRWDRKIYTGNEVSGKTLAIIGLGRIGREVAIRMRAFGMRIVGYDPMIPASVISQYNIEFAELEKIWPQADFISVHTPLVPATENLINLSVLKKCKKDVKIINAARGGIVSETDLLQALNEGLCGGAALDVFTEEPPVNGVHALIKHPKVIATPHLGASTVEAQERVGLELAEQIGELIQFGKAFGMVNNVSIGA